ncbi:Ig-like domain-containing protein [Anaeromyxobacter oryzae]|uniref:BIG2 domain-containing protein n=1 Tax=Anaeromyxobacter oryzae TaxID=2918170 RepID=A0ABN6MXT4_9BACT|nr:hypothetical protein [Anaeromyxobacter oryzae]BDG04597.1 hypothetical protein AMOR_35930 [Anaeromyxobacter oryzae]
MNSRALAVPLAAVLVAACSKAERIELDPGSVRFAGTGKSSKVHATPLDRRGQPVPDQTCVWSSTDEKVATVKGVHNDATITAAGPGSAAVRCAIGGVAVEAPIVVRVVARVVVAPERAELKMQDEAAPLALQVQAFDDQGAPFAGRVATVTCASEDVCRGDARGQLWAVGPGATTATVEVEGARTTLPVHVVDARTAEGKPRAVKGNPMEEIERAVKARDEAERRARK